MYYPDSVSKNCKNCNHPTETASHVLNGCGEFQENYTSRHNRICNIIYQNLKKLNYLSIQVNPLITKIFILADQVDRQINVERNHPDFVLTDNRNSRVFIVELSCLFDAFTDNVTHIRETYMNL